MAGEEPDGARSEYGPALNDAETALDELLAEAHVLGAYDLPALTRRKLKTLGATDALCYLADLQQAVLIPFAPSDGPDELDPADGPERLEDRKPMAIDSTLAGRAFQNIEVLTQRRPDGSALLWLPLLDGTERLGVLAVSIDDVEVNPPTETDVRRFRRFAAILAELIMTKTSYGDTIVRLRRQAPMALAAEMQWSLLPPLTFACREVTVAAALEPAYEVAGDTVDYAVDAGIAQIALFDGMGHGLPSAQLAALAVAAYRHGRRAGNSLVEICREIDDTLLAAFGGTTFTTAVLAELDTTTGALRWVNAGHPEPLLIRQGQLVRTLKIPPRPPLGVNLRGTAASAVPEVGREQLEPGDCVLIYSDGVTEARSATGDFFGEQRLVDLVVRNLAAGLPAPETMRRVVRELMTHQDGRLSDDASLALVRWQTDVDTLTP
jgi:Stage II sporulation protein E (SpoIIE)